MEKTVKEAEDKTREREVNGVAVAKDEGKEEETSVRWSQLYIYTYKYRNFEEPEESESVRRLDRPVGFRSKLYKVTGRLV